MRAPASTIIADKVSLAPIMINGRRDSDVEGLGMKMVEAFGYVVLRLMKRRFGESRTFGREEKSRHADPRNTT